MYNKTNINHNNMDNIMNKKADSENDIKAKKWINGFIKTAGHEIPKVSTKLRAEDVILNWLVRWNINRMNYKIKEGLYAVGNPKEDSIVFVTANYKFTFDNLRKELDGINAWIVVLDTKGINVWCAAGKGTFGTQELIKRIHDVKLKEIVNHRKLILPQLGASGVSAHIVKKASGFKVLYGPIKAKDIKNFIGNNFKKTEKMKEVNFKFFDRLVLIPVEFVGILKYLLLGLIVIFLIDLIKYRSININFIFTSVIFIGSIFTGCIFTPLLLPFIPFRSFALKGFILGLIWVLLASIVINKSLIYIISNILLLTPFSSFAALNFTGSSTYTSVSGVKFEIKIATPIMIISLLCGIILKISIELNII